ncbi:50S ribosomal protein L37ae [Acidianus manzaensis]|uniref:Large ribosomal subunit protein eL43 n=1 Tax=Acidianus manzaensis TaxID=282676 RepID=A0A1W6K068_9CREN|nr:50S ribosomal protein L37ae [Acidianus manzaensis]ARM75916.1 50S ribosomal protein L37ae [Acidianus manzaensis]
MAKYKVVGIAGRYGARYGATLRKTWKEVMEKRYQDYQCPSCKTVGSVERLASGIWYCKKCGNKWAGFAYTPY